MSIEAELCPKCRGAGSQRTTPDPTATSLGGTVCYYCHGTGAVLARKETDEANLPKEKPRELTIDERLYFQEQGLKNLIRRIEDIEGRIAYWKTEAESLRQVVLDSYRSAKDALMINDHPGDD